MSGQERRKNPRFRVDVPARITVGQETLVGRLRDVCRDAALLEANRWFPLETHVSVAMELPGTGGPIQVTGKIIRLAPGDEGTHGMAVLFEDLSQAFSDRIDFFITQQEG